MEFYERVSGARMHAAFHKPLPYFNFFLDKQLLTDILFFVKGCFITLNEMHNVLTLNKVWKLRLKNNGVLNINCLENYGISGVLQRSIGVKKDLRLIKHQTYSNYKFLNFFSYTTKNGDSFDRFLLRMYEINESMHIISQNIKAIFPKEKQKILQVRYGGKFLFYRQNYVIKIDSNEVLVFDYEYELCIERLPFDNELSKIKIDEFDGENITTIKKVGDRRTLLKSRLHFYGYFCIALQYSEHLLSSSYAGFFQIYWNWKGRLYASWCSRSIGWPVMP